MELSFLQKPIPTIRKVMISTEQILTEEQKQPLNTVLSKRIVSERISGKGMVETEPKIDCKENCTEEGYA